MVKSKGNLELRREFVKKKVVVFGFVNAYRLKLSKAQPDETRLLVLQVQIGAYRVIPFLPRVYDSFIEFWPVWSESDDEQT
jgi:hypothetical protein